MLAAASSAATADEFNNLAKATELKTAAAAILSTAQAALTTLQSDTATAQATVDELGRRIVRANTEIAELVTLSDATNPGILDAASTLRLADFNAFASVNAAAIAEKAAADLAVRAAVTTVGAEVAAGALTSAKDVANTAWTAAKLATVAAEAALSTALSGTVLATLR